MRDRQPISWHDAMLTVKAERERERQQKAQGTPQQSPATAGTGKVVQSGAKLIHVKQAE